MCDSPLSYRWPDPPPESAVCLRCNDAPQPRCADCRGTGVRRAEVSLADQWEQLGAEHPPDVGHYGPPAGCVAPLACRHLGPCGRLVPCGDTPPTDQLSHQVAPRDPAGPPATEPAPTRRDACKSCGAAIIWVTSQKSGKPLPIDAEPNPEGKLIRVGSSAVVRWLAANEDRKHYRYFYTSHFQTCPDARSWSKSRSKP